MPFGLCVGTRLRNHELNGYRKFGERVAHCDDFLLWAVQKRLNRSTCRLGCGHAWAEGSICSIQLARRCQCAHTTGRIGDTWRLWLNHPSAVVMQSITLTTCFFVTPNFCSLPEAKPQSRILWCLIHWTSIPSYYISRGIKVQKISLYPYFPPKKTHQKGTWTSGYIMWFTAGDAIRIAHYDVIDDVITRKL